MTTTELLRIIQFVAVYAIFPLLTQGQTFLDTNFANNGILITPSGNGSLKDIAELSDGSFVSVFQDGNPSVNGQINFRHHDQFGNQNMAFGTNGLLRLDTAIVPDNEITGIFKYGDDNILAYGRSYGSIWKDFVVRILPDGQVDENFGSNGYFFYAPNESGARFYDIDTQSDGKIILAGTLFGTYLILRLNTDGNMDSSFGVNGIFTSQPDGQYRKAVKLCIDSNDNITFCGNSASNFLITFLRLSPEGVFDENYYQYTELMQYGVFDFIVNPADEMFILAKLNFSSYTSIVCLYPDGTTKPSFANNGALAINPPLYNTFINQMCFDNDYNLIVGGYRSDGDFSEIEIFIMGVNGNGQIDYNFGSNGTMITEELLNNNAQLYEILCTSDGKLIAAASQPNVTCKFALESVTTETTNGQKDDCPMEIRISNDHLYLNLNFSYSRCDIFDMQSRLLYYKDIRMFDMLEVDLSVIPSAFYILRLTGNDGKIEVAKVANRKY